MGRKIVIALGGNALGKSPDEQRLAVTAAAGNIAALVRDGYEIVLVHGNGTQVGMINLAFDYGKRASIGIPYMPFAECTAMSQGYIGFHLQNALQNIFRNEGVRTSVTTVVTQVLVDPDDPAFQHPTKPVGLFYSEEEAKRISADRGFVFAEDSGRGFRRVVPSPQPVEILEQDAIRFLMENGHIVIACGGGGISVCPENGMVRGIDAVIDKDRAGAVLAEAVQADILLILTAVPYAALNYGKPDQIWIRHMTVGEARKYMEQGQFATGSMLPKVEASVRFASSAPGRKAIITYLENAYSAVTENRGTIIVGD